MSLDICAHPHGNVVVARDESGGEYTLIQCFVVDPTLWERAHLSVVYCSYQNAGCTK
jgi:hypothetical protein